MAMSYGSKKMCWWNKRNAEQKLCLTSWQTEINLTLFLVKENCNSKPWLMTTFSFVLATGLTPLLFCVSFGASVPILRCGLTIWVLSEWLEGRQTHFKGFCISLFWDEQRFKDKETHKGIWRCLDLWRRPRNFQDLP